ncbi:MAG TPA: DUF1501 domain-containing protein [Vicinamibacterales bacterium]|nr:DUF1501 domain-containing protein [Vicinamibacterales bacterium]
MIDRRIFLKNGGMALVSLGFAPTFLARAAWAAERHKVLIAIFQRGAVDGLNMVVPFGDAGYYAARPSIAIAQPGRPDGALDLDGFFGLHPRMASLMPFWNRGDLAIIHATGSHDDTRSHFDATDYMESGTPGVKSTRDGWLNRYLHAKEHQKATPFRAVALAPQLPRSLQGTAPSLAIARLDQFGLRPGAGGAAASFEAEYAAAAGSALGRTGTEAFEAIRALRAADPARYTPANGADYPRSPYGDSLRQIAQLVKANVGLEIAFAESGNWDHHANEGGAAGQIANRLDDFARGIAALATDLGEAMRDVVILTMSEFGRTVAENGNRGTDHGHGNAMLALGGGVKGRRVHGRWPGLAVEQRWQRRDLAITTDFRDVFAEVVTRHLGLRDASAVFPRYSIDEKRFAGFMS